jgi:hypothetical protein
MPKLEKINLKRGKESNHPDIKADNKTPYLIKYDGEWFAGTFEKVWFGISFNGWHAPLQFDTPGYNSSDWQEVYRIRIR